MFERPSEEQWAMLEEMRPHFCCLTLDSDYDFVWDIRGIWHEEMADRDKEDWLSGPSSHQSLGSAIEAAYARFTAELKSSSSA